MKAEEDFVPLVSGLRCRDRDAAGALAGRFYPELQRLALTYMQGENPGHTRQDAVLVNEIFPELCRIRQLEEMVARTRDVS